MLEHQGLIQFFQHAHHRVEGWLMDFQEGLERGEVDAALVDRVAHALRQHMFAEEEIVFPLAKERLAVPIADLEEEHGHIWDVLDALFALLRGSREQDSTRTLAGRLMGLLAAHHIEEDMGVYPDLVDVVGPDRASALVVEADRAEVPAGWLCKARRSMR